MGLISEQLEDVFIERKDLEELFSKWGREIATVYDTESILKMIDTCITIGKINVLDHLFSILNKSVEFWIDMVKAIAGKDIFFNPASKRWHDVESGRFVKDPYVIVRQNLDTFVDELRRKYID
ncbi:MAG: hypothetical protein QXL73_05485 [Thermoplasmata archaeon]